MIASVDLHGRRRRSKVESGCSRDPLRVVPGAPCRHAPATGPSTTGRGAGARGALLSTDDDGAIVLDFRNDTAQPALVMVFIGVS
jgi:hypothetical protein